MNQPWTFAQWHPSKTPAPGDPELDETSIAALTQQLIADTNDLAKHSYNPATWLNRSRTLFRLKYPELALGDVYKADVLSSAHLAKLREGGWMLGHRMGFWMDREDVDEEEESVACLEGGLDEMQQRARRAMADCVPDCPGQEYGKFRRRRYPWMSGRFARRDEGLLRRMNEEFREHSARQDRRSLGEDVPGKGTACVVKRHAFGDGGVDGDTENVLGVFAARAIADEEVILVDRPRVFSCTERKEDGVTSVMYDYEEDYDVPIHPKHEDDDTRADLGWITERCGAEASSVVEVCRLLECCVQDHAPHPLDHHLVARMTPNYPSEREDEFSLTADIVLINETLQQLGIDIFANAAFDTWVVFTIEARLRNNSCSPSVGGNLLSPLFSLFNHSCAPNARWTIDVEHHVVVVQANREIREGEQLFVTYHAYCEDMGLERRRAVMWAWLDAPCQCTRCVRDESASKICRAGMSGRDEATRQLEWDSYDPLELPEDELKLRN